MLTYLIKGTDMSVGLNPQIFIVTSNVRKSSEAEAGVQYLGVF